MMLNIAEMYEDYEPLGRIRTKKRKQKTETKVSYKTFVDANLKMFEREFQLAKRDATAECHIGEDCAVALYLLNQNPDDKDLANEVEILAEQAELEWKFKEEYEQKRWEDIKRRREEFLLNAKQLYKQYCQSEDTYYVNETIPDFILTEVQSNA